MTIERALELLPQMRDSEWITALGQKTALYTDEAKEAFNMAISALEKQEEDRWIPVTERLPEKEGCYLVTVKNDHERRYSKTAWYSGDGWFARQDIIAWRPLPEPYTEEES
jgi:hypothetical protein